MQSSLKLSAVLAAFAAATAMSMAAVADTSDVTWQTRVVVEKTGDHCADDPKCFNRYHPAGSPGGIG